MKCSQFLYLQRCIGKRIHQHLSASGGFFMIIFIFIRLLDLYSTYLNMELTNSWSDIESAPVSKFLISHFSYFQFVIINLTISIVLGYLLWKWAPAILKIFNVVNFTVVLINFFTYAYTLYLLS